MWMQERRKSLLIVFSSKFHEDTWGLGQKASLFTCVLDTINGVGDMVYLDLSQAHIINKNRLMEIVSHI